MVVTRSTRSIVAKNPTAARAVAAAAAFSSSPIPSTSTTRRNARTKKRSSTDDIETTTTSKKQSSSSSQKASIVTTPISHKESKSLVKKAQTTGPTTKSGCDVDDATNNKKPPLLSLPDDIVVGILQHRPSKRNRSPYVGDVIIPSQNNRVAICHLPNLDMGGKCVEGSTLVMKPARDKKGNLVGPNATSPKFGTPKCEYIAQLLRVDESQLSSSPSSTVNYHPVWVGAHPTLGEMIAEQLIGENLLLSDDFPHVKSYQREVRNPAGLDLRADFVVTHTDPTKLKRIVEVKTVVDTDYSPDAVPPAPPPSPNGKKSSDSKKRCVFTSSRVPYRRTGIFPWGTSGQKGPDGEAVVSARAIKHVRELTRVVLQRRENRKSKSKNNDDSNGKESEEEDNDYDSTILFVVIRGDAKAFRPNIDACPSFARYLKEAQDAGVQIIAKQVVWGEENDGQLGNCYEGEMLEIEWP